MSLKRLAMVAKSIPASQWYAFAITMATAILAMVLLILPDYLMSFFVNNLPYSLILKPKYYLLLLVIGMLLVLTKPGWIRNSMVALLGIVHLIWFGWFAYSGGTLDPQHVIRAFKDAIDLIDFAKEDTSGAAFLLPPIIIVLTSYTALFLLLRLSARKTLQFRYAPIIFLLIIALVPLRIALRGERDFYRFYPRTDKPALLNVFNSFALAGFIAGLRTAENMAPHGLAPYKITPVALPENPITIGIIMGESIAGQRLSIFGHSQETTPNLARRLKTSGPFKLFARKGFSASVTSRTSIPLFYNGQKNPRHTEITELNIANFFRLGKRNGFETYYFSSQVGSMMLHASLQNIDKHAVREMYEERINKIRDDILPELLEKEVKPAPRRLIYLHQRVNHALYRANCAHVPHINTIRPKTMSFNDQRRAEYDNGLRCWDRNVDNILKYFEQQPGAVYVFITADHGEMMGQYGLWGHLTLKMEGAVVPMLLFTNRPDSEIAQKFQSMIPMTHFKMVQLINRTLGFDIQDPNTGPETFYVNGTLSFGKGDYLEGRILTPPNKFQVIRKNRHGETIGKPSIFVLK